MGEKGSQRVDVTVLIVDDQPFFPAAARAVLDTVPHFSAVGEASSGLEALRVVAELRPDLVLIDVRMPGIDGIEAARRIMAGHPGTVVLLVSTDDVADTVAVSACGAVAFVRKQDFGPTFLRSVWAQHGPRAPAGTRRRTAAAPAAERS